MQWLLLAFFAALVGGGKKGGAGALLKSPVTFGVVQLVAGKSYHFTALISGLEAAGGHPSEQVIGMLSALQLAGAWDLYATPTSPTEIRYSLTATTTRALSVGAPYPANVQGVTVNFTCTSVQEVAKRKV